MYYMYKQNKIKWGIIWTCSFQVLEYQKQKLPAVAMFFAKSSIFSTPETKVAHSLHVFAMSRQNEESL